MISQRHFPWPPPISSSLKDLIETVKAPSQTCPTIRKIVLWEFYNINKQTSAPADTMALRMRYRLPAAALLITREGGAGLRLRIRTGLEMKMKR